MRTDKITVTREYLEHLESALTEAQDWLGNLINPDGLTEHDRTILEYIDGAVINAHARRAAEQ